MIDLTFADPIRKLLAVIRRLQSSLAALSANNGQLTVRIGISIVALILILMHLFIPSNRVDGVAVALLAVLILPWVGSFIKHLELSASGAKIEYHELQKAAEQVVETTPTDEHVEPPSASEPAPTYIQIRTTDPNLALVGLRIEIESRLNQLAQLADVHFNRTSALSHLIRALEQRGILSDTQATGLRQLVTAGNAAAHGAVVDENVAAWAFQSGPDILAALDSLLATRYYDGLARQAVEAALPPGTRLTISYGDSPDASFVTNGKRYAIEIKRLTHISGVSVAVQQASRWIDKGFAGSLIVTSAPVEDDRYIDHPAIRIASWLPNTPIEPIRAAIAELLQTTGD